MSVEIYVHKVVLDNGVRFDILGKNLPDNLLGIAADLKFSGDWKNYKMEKWDLGDAWAGSKDFEPIVLVKTAEGEKVIFGITQKVNQMSVVKDGKILSVEFAGKGNLNFVNFEHQVMSTFAGKRVDLNDVIWKNSLPAVSTSTKLIKVAKENVAVLTESEKLENPNSDALEIDDENIAQVKESSLKDWQANILQNEDQNDWSANPNLLFLPIIIIAIVLITALVLKLIRSRKQD